MRIKLIYAKIEIKNNIANKFDKENLDIKDNDSFFNNMEISAQNRQVNIIIEEEHNINRHLDESSINDHTKNVKM